MMMCQRSVNRVWLAGVGFGFGTLPGFAGLGGFTGRARFAMFPARALLPRATLLSRAIVELAQRTTKRFDLALIREFLAFGEFDEFQNFFHLVNSTLERLNDLHYLVDGLADGSPAMDRFSLGMANTFGETLDAFQQWAGFGARRSGLSRALFARVSLLNGRCIS